MRVGRPKWFNLLRLLPISFRAPDRGCGCAKEPRDVPAVASFIADYPGALPPPNKQGGIPGWVGRQNFFNLFLLTFILRSGSRS